MNTILKRSLFLTGLLLWLSVTGLLLAATDPAHSTYEPVGTLVPPTLVPTIEPGLIDAIPAESTVARIQASGRVRVGILFNEPPFGLLNLRGEIFGFDADLARKMAELWEVELELVQVTRQTAHDMLLTDQVDLLIATQVHRRETDRLVEYSQTYYPGEQVIMVRNGDGATVLGHMQDRVVGVVMGTRGEAATAEWLNRSGLNVTVRRFVTLDQALSALLASEIDGVVSTRLRLSRAVPDREIARFVDEPVGAEPYAVVMRRRDVNMRNLVNRTLQYMVENGQMNTIHQAHFSGVNYPVDDFTIWDDLGENAPRPGDFATDVPLPPQNVLPRLQAEGVLRVAGLPDSVEEARESERRLYDYNRALVEALASRWGVRVELLSNSADNPLEFVANGQADIAVSVRPTWTWADRVDFTSHYLLHGQRLLVPVDSDIGGFTDLRSEWVAVFADEPEAEDLVEELAESARARVDIYTITNEAETANGLLVQNNYDAVFGDSLKLIPHVQANPDELMLTVDADGNPRWYSRAYIGLAVPRNDIDFRLLVEYTLQELSREGVLGNLATDVMLPEEIPSVSIWPGPSQYMGYNLSG